jgi:hypothetical protein
MNRRKRHFPDLLPARRSVLHTAAQGKMSEALERHALVLLAAAGEMSYYGIGIEVHEW